jgi:hypothetical protein
VLEVRQLKTLLKRDCGVELSLEETWSRALELLAFTKAILEALPPPKPKRSDPVRASSPVVS